MLFIQKLLLSKLLLKINLDHDTGKWVEGVKTNNRAFEQARSAGTK
jgi:hypothetical protein